LFFVANRIVEIIACVGIEMIAPGYRMIASARKKKPRKDKPSGAACSAVKEAFSALS